MVKIVYYGTTHFSASVLEALARTQGFDIVAVVTRAPQPVGRSQTLTPSAVETLARQLTLPVYAPESLKTFDSSLLPPHDLAIVYAYGLIIPEAMLSLPIRGAINIHPSLLPKYRGPTPIQSAIMNGDTETGVSIMLLDKEMDHGPIFAQIHEPIRDDDTNDSLTARLVQKSIPVLVDIVPAWVERRIQPKQQNHSEATLCKLLTREDGKIDWKKNAGQIFNAYRALTPWPGVWTTWGDRRLKLLKLNRVEGPTPVGPAGQVAVYDNRCLILTGQGAIEVNELQVEGSKPMSAQAFINGNRTFAGSILI